MPVTDSMATSSRSSLRVLLVEDDPTARDVALLLLDRLGCHPAVAPDGLTAVAAAKAAAYDVVLMDVQMPCMDGVEAARRIRSDAAGPDRPTIIAMTADTTLQCRERCLAAGMDHHLAKPVHIDDLAESLDDEVQRRASPGQPGFPVLGSRDPTVRPPAPADPGRLTTDADGPRVYDSGILDALIAELGGDGAALRRDLIESYLLDVGERLPVIVASGRSSDLDVLVFQAHALKSASAMIGLVAVSDIASDVELRAQTAPDGVDASDEATRLAAACDRAIEALRHVLDSEGCQGAGSDIPNA